MEELLSKIKEVLEGCAKNRKYITQARLYKEVGLRKNNLNKKKYLLFLSLINDEIYREKGVIVLSLVILDKKYFPVKMFFDYCIFLNLINRKCSKKEKNNIWNGESSKCFDYYENVW